MSFREKSAWISVLSMSGIYGFYFWSVIHAGPQAGRFRFGGLLETIIALVVLQVALTNRGRHLRAQRSEGAARRARQTDRAQVYAGRLRWAGDERRACLLFRSLQSSDRLQHERSAVHSGNSRDPALRLPDRPIPAGCLTWE